MKKFAVAMVFLWSYLLVTAYFGLNSYSGSGMKSLFAWQLMLASAAAIPIIALLLLNFARLSGSDNNAVKAFLSLNKKQLIAYGIGALLLVIIIGALIMAIAALWAVLLNASLLFMKPKQKNS